MLKYNKHKIKLLLGDLIIVIISIIAASFLRTGNGFIFFNSIEGMLVILFLTGAVTIPFYIFDQYKLESSFFQAKGVSLYLVSLGATILFVVALFYIMPYSIGRGIFFYFILIVAILSAAWRVIIFKKSDGNLNPSSIIFIGSPEEHEEISRLITESVGLRLVDKDNPLNRGMFNGNGDPDINNSETTQDIDMIILGNTEVDKNTAEKLISYRLKGTRIFDLPTFYEMTVQKLPIFFINDEWILRCPGFERLGDSFYSKVKRIIDIVLSSVFLLILVPIFLIISVLIKIDSKGPVFYIQERCGLNERPFKLIKFRTMVNDAEKDGPKWAQENDSRVTRIGRILRKSRLDELPQLINILRGEMSFVGPRPERDYFVSILKRKIPYYSMRFFAKPGITGWAQINYRYGASIEDAIEKLAYDLYYIKNMSFLLDLKIALKTIKTVLFGDGAR